MWSLQEMGIRAVVGSSFGDIFFANCFQNGILPIIVDKATVDGLAAEIELTQGAGRVASISRSRRLSRRQENHSVSRSIRAGVTASCRGSTKSP